MFYGYIYEIIELSVLYCSFIVGLN